MCGMHEEKVTEHIGVLITLHPGSVSAEVEVTATQLTSGRKDKVVNTDLSFPS